MRATGKVLDSTGFPLEGVNISVVGTTRGAITNSFGNFNIDINPNEKLRFSFVGLVPQERVFSNETPVTIVLQEDEAFAFPEVIVTAPGPKHSEGKTAIWPWLLLVAGIGYLATRKKAKKVTV